MDTHMASILLFDETSGMPLAVSSTSLMLQ